MRDRRISRRGFLAGGMASVLSLLRPWEALAGRARVVPIVCRRAWGAEAPRGGLQEHTIERLTVHHSGMVLRDNRDAPGRFRAHQQAHFGNGWPDIAYHVLIDRRGNVYRGRNARYRGDTATDYDPAGHLLVMCEGNFDDQDLSSPQMAALVDVLAWACERFGVSPGTIRGHGDWASTSCPGRRLQRAIDNRRVRRRVRRRLRGGGVKLEILCGKAGRRRVRRIEAGRA